MMEGDSLKPNSLIELFIPVDISQIWSCWRPTSSYNLFDFYADPGAEEDKDNFIAKVQRRDIVMLGRVSQSQSLYKNKTQREYAT